MDASCEREGGFSSPENGYVIENVLNPLSLMIICFFYSPIDRFYHTSSETHRSS